MNAKRWFFISALCLALSVCLSFVGMLQYIEYVNDVKELSNSIQYDLNRIIISLEEQKNEEKEKSIEGHIEVESFEEEIPEIEIIEKISLGEFRLTAYCSCEKCCGEWALNRPKDENGKDIVYGSTGAALIAGISIAVDPAVIPYGSQVEINGHTYTAHDCGGAIKGNRIDVYFDTHEEAREFAVQYAEVFLLEDSQ